MNLENIKKIYFIGIGGIGMSAVAGIAREKGFQVSGSDASDVYEPSKGVLDKYQIPYVIGYVSENLKDADLVVTTSAVDQSNPEVAAAIEKNIPIVSFAAVLAELVKDKTQIMVVGTHGKGTTSGLISYVLQQIEDSSFFVGGVLTDLKTNYHYGTGKYFVIEGDEYKANFDNNKPKFSFFQPEVLLINNLEYDHPDLYPDIQSYKKAFAELAESLPVSSTIVFNSDDKNVIEVIGSAKAKKVGFSLKEKAVNVGEGVFQFHTESGIEVQTRLPGQPYAYDNLAAATVLLELGFAPEQFLPMFLKYSGIKRRYEIIEDGQFAVIDDYAHHPTAVKQTIEATKEKYPGRRIVAFFEPHTYSRTKETLSDLAKAFGAADLVYLAEIYPAREQKLPSSISGLEVVDQIKENNPNTYYVKNKEDALAQYSQQAKEGDVVVVMAVGSFNTLAYDLKEKYGI